MRCCHQPVLPGHCVGRSATRRAFRTSRTRIGLSRCVVIALAILCLTPGCATIGASNRRDWSPDQEVLTYADFKKDSVRVHNIRNCTYRTADDYTVDHYNKTFELEGLEGCDFIVVPFPGTPALAHTFVSFAFEGGEYLACSIEIRKEQGEEYDPVMGMLDQYEIMYVWGDERDLVQLRANHRLDEVYIYPVRASKAAVRALFADMLTRTNQLVDRPEFYHSITNNCTTNIVRHVNRVAPNKVPYDEMMVLPGFSDQLAYDLGLIDTDRSFAETREAARINELAFRYRDQPDFSQRIREGGTLFAHRSHTATSDESLGRY